MTPTQRTLKALRDMGYRADVAEYWQPSSAARQVVEEAQRWAKSSTTDGLLQAIASLEESGPGKRRDLFGFLDILAIGRGKTLGVQCTATSGISARITKIQIERQAESVAWLEDGNALEVWGWKKYSKRVDGKLWRPTRKFLTLASNGGISVCDTTTTL